MKIKGKEEVIALSLLTYMGEESKIKEREEMIV